MKEVDEVAVDLATTFLACEEWQILYRGAQLSRAVGGQPQLLERALKVTPAEGYRQPARLSRRTRATKRLRRGARKAICAQDRLAGAGPNLLQGLIDRIFRKR